MFTQYGKKGGCVFSRMFSMRGGRMALV